MPVLWILLDFLCFVYGSWGGGHCKSRWEYPVNCVCGHRLACNFRCIIIPSDFFRHLYDDFAPLPPSTVIFFPVSRDPPYSLPFSPSNNILFFPLSTNPTSILLWSPLFPWLPAVTWGYIFISQYSELGISDEREHAALALGVWATLLDNIFSSPVTLPASFTFFFNDRIAFHSVHAPLFHCSFVSWGHLGCFHFLASVHRAAMNMLSMRCLRRSIFWAYGKGVV